MLHRNTGLGGGGARRVARGGVVDADRGAADLVVPPLYRMLHEYLNPWMNVGAGGGGESGEAMSLMGSALPQAGSPLTGQTRGRTNWSRLGYKRIAKEVRELAERNWFLQWVLPIRHAFCSVGFRFAGADARNFVRAEDEEGSGMLYDFFSVQDDMWREYLLTDNVVAFWRRNDGEELPHIFIPDLETVDWISVGGFEQIEVKFQANRKLPDELRERLGDQLFKAMKEGGKFVVQKAAGEDLPEEDYDFMVLKAGKSGGGFARPSVASVMDDLEHIEVSKVGDFAGAWKRNQIIRQTKKGMEPKSGMDLDPALYKTSKKVRDGIAAMMAKISGATDIATNWDQVIDYLVFPSDVHFGDNVTREALRRLVNWGGFPAVMLMEGFSQVHGVSPYLTMMMRIEVTAMREKMGSFLWKIFNAESFRGSTNEVELRPVWAAKSLYSNAELVAFVNMLVTNAGMSPQSVREKILDLDNDEEVELFKAAHADREGYAPVFEPRQGLLPAMFSDLQEGGSTGPQAPGEPGRPKEA